MTNEHNGNPESSKYCLPPDEAVYVDTLLEHGANERTISMPTAGGTCPPRLADIIHALSQLPAGEPSGNLVSRTVAAAGAVQLTRVTPHAGSSVLTNTRPLGRAWDPRKVDIAVMLIAAALLLTVTVFQLAKARTFELRTACANNLALVGTAFEQYASTNSNMLPRIAIPVDHNWLPRNMTPQVDRTANAHCNLANLEPMLGARTHYTSWTRLICPAMGTSVNFNQPKGRPVWSNIGYSYIDQLSAYHHHWAQGGHIAILADRNPLFYEHHPQQANINSLNHNRSGQNVLFDDGSVFWTRSPNVGPKHDNIWTIGSPPILVYTGVEEPTSRHDIILVP